MWLSKIEEKAEITCLAAGRVSYRNGLVREVRVEAGVIRGKVAEGAGFTHDVAAKADVTAEAVGGNDLWHEVAIKVSPYGALEWQNVENLELPGLDPVSKLTPLQALAQLEKRLSHLGLQTFAQKLDSWLEFECTCGDYNKPCKHAVAVWCAFGEEVRTDPSVLVTLFGGQQERWKGAQPRKKPADSEELGIPLVLTPADVEHNLQDRPIEELISRYWRPIREIKLDVRVQAIPPQEPVVPHQDHAAVQQVLPVLKEMYSVIRKRATGELSSQ